jgi:hypothetical protein
MEIPQKGEWPKRHHHRGGGDEKEKRKRKRKKGIYGDAIYA